MIGSLTLSGFPTGSRLLLARSPLVAGVLIGIALVAISGCSETGPHPVTDAEADRLAEALYANWEAGGVTFELNAAPAAGESVRVQGEVDFGDQAGYGLVNAVGEDSPVKGVIFTTTTILENIPDLVDASVAVGGPEFVWVARPVDTSAYQLDGLLGVVFGLATQQRDNPELISQSGAKWIRGDTLRDTAVDVFEYSPQARFWIEQGGTRLLRFEGNNATLTRPIVIDITEVGPVTQPTFADTDVVTPQDLDGLYDAYRRGSRG